MSLCPFRRRAVSCFRRLAALSLAHVLGLEVVLDGMTLVCALRAPWLARDCSGGYCRPSRVLL